MSQSDVTIPISVIKDIRWLHNETFMDALTTFGETYATRHLETELDVAGAVEKVLASVCAEHLSGPKPSKRQYTRPVTRGHLRLVL